MHLPRIPYLLEAIVNGEVNTFVKPLPRSAVRDAASKGYTELSACGFKDPLGKLEFAVQARKPGTDEEITIFRIRNVGELHPAVTDTDTVMDVLYSLETRARDKGTSTGTPYSYKSLRDAIASFEKLPPTIPAYLSPFKLAILDLKFERIQDITPERMLDEGLMELGPFEPLPIEEEDKEYEKKFRKKHHAADGSCYRFDLLDIEYDDDMTWPTPEQAYRAFIRKAYGHKVWDDNEYVVRITVAPVLSSIHTWGFVKTLDELHLTDIFGCRAAYALRKVSAQTGKPALRIVQEKIWESLGLPNYYETAAKRDEN